MRNILFCSIVFSLSVFPLIFCSAKAESVLEETHSDWSSRVVYSNDEIRFRATATYAESGDFVILTMDRFPNNCESQYMALNIAASNPAKISSVTNALFGAIRIDENPIHNMSYKISFEKGEKIFFVNIVNFDGENTLLDELREGGVLRFKLHASEEDYFLRFSLNGYREAQQRTKVLCDSFNKGKKDEDYFPSENKPPVKMRDDKTYF